MEKDRKLIIVGNWKMNKTVAEALDLVRGLKRNLGQVKEVDIVVCPPFTALSEVSQEIIDSNLRLGAQNMSEYGAGARTGEIAAEFLKEFLVRYVILGHSERRQYQKETNELVAQKAAAAELGIHTHNDADMAVAGAIAAVDAGCAQVQGTMNGYGERCGNANLVSVIANLKLKMGVDCVSDAQAASLTDASRFVAEVANMPPPAAQPYVGGSAFAHKGGLHAAAVSKVEHSYQHIPPQSVGNGKRVLVSDLSGRGNILWRARELCPDAELSPAQARELLAQVKQLESKGFQYEGAEASFEMLVRRMQPGYAAHFKLLDFVSMVEMRRGSHYAELNGNGTSGGGAEGEVVSRVTLNVMVGDEPMLTAADGNGPVNALDHALRKALDPFYPDLRAVRLMDYKVRVVDGVDELHAGTGSVVRVLIESTDGKTSWSTVGSSENIIEASWIALADSLEYWLTRSDAHPCPAPAANGMRQAVH